MTIDPERPQPLYLQLADLIEGQIRSGELAPGRRLPSETTLVQEHGIARQTVRKAMSVLQERGLVTAVHGRGSWVTERH